MKKPWNKSNIRSLRRKLTALNEQRTMLIFGIIHGKPMIHGMLHEVFRKCGKKNCICSQGPPHGPYPALSVNRLGKQKIILIKKADAARVIKKSKRYRYYRQTLANIRKINREIDSLLEDIKILTTGNYP